MLFSTLCIVTITGEMIGVLNFLFGEILMKTTTCLCEAASIESTRIARVGGDRCTVKSKKAGRVAAGLAKHGVTSQFPSSRL